jgi:hypothetical protein
MVSLPLSDSNHATLVVSITSLPNALSEGTLVISDGMTSNTTSVSGAQGYGSGSYFIIPCTSGSFVTDRTYLPLSMTTVVNLSGSNTNWTGSSVFSVTGATLVSQTIIDANSFKYGEC